MLEVFDHGEPEMHSPWRASAMLPSGTSTASALPCTRFRGSILGLRFPLSTLRIRPYGRSRMTRGQHDWLDLYCRALSSPTPYRF